MNATICTKVVNHEGPPHYCEKPRAEGSGLCVEHAAEAQEWLDRPYGWDCGICWTSARFHDLKEAQVDLVAHHLDKHFPLHRDLWPLVIAEMEQRT